MNEIPKIKFKSTEEINKILSSDEFKKGCEEVNERGKKLLESTKIDWKTLNRPFQ